MSVLKFSKYGFLISHKTAIDEIYSETNDSQDRFQLKAELFNIVAPYKTSKTNKCKKRVNITEEPFAAEVCRVEELFKKFYGENKEFFENVKIEVKCLDAVTAANEIYDKTGQDLISDSYGTNPDTPITKLLKNSTFLFPKGCKFYAKDVTDLSLYLNDKYDLILLDPPWWNKYIRRKRKHSEQGYDMMYNEDLKNIPLEDHLKDDALVIVWCTNSEQHLNALCNEIFPKWGIKFLGKWYWIKVTQTGVPICEFAQPPRKQPFEQIIFGCKEARKLPHPPCDKLVVSVPSAIHSHKPPLMNLLEPFLPENPKRLELFARYLLPNWTSYGKEVLRFQHESLYEKLSNNLFKN